MNNYSRGFIGFTHRILLTVSMGLLLTTTPSFGATQETGKVGVVDMSKVRKQLLEWKKTELKKAEVTLQAFIEQIRPEVQKEVGPMQLDLKKTIETYNKQFKSLSQAANKSKTDEINKKKEAIDKIVNEKYNRVVAEKDNELLKPINNDLDAVISSIAQKEGFTLVLDKTVQIYGTPEHDLTFKVLNEMNIK